jgi:hypothetical protein
VLKIVTLLSSYGQVIVSKEVTSEVQKIDLRFTPNTSNMPAHLGLLGKLSRGACLFEPYRNPVNLDDILDCLDKRLTVRGLLRRKAKKNKRPISNDEIPFVWILTPTASETVLKAFASHLTSEWGEGIYLLPEPLKTGVVVIHQLPETPETLWLRLVGRGRKRDKAIAELESLPPANPLRSDTLELLYNVKRNLEAAAKTTQEDREFIMRLAPLYQQEKAQTLQEGRQQEAATLVIKLLQRRFGEISQNIEETIRGLSIERLEDLAVALLDFEGITTLVNWLEERASTTDYEI